MHPNHRILWIAGCALAISCASDVDETESIDSSGIDSQIAQPPDAAGVNDITPLRDDTGARDDITDASDTTGPMDSSTEPDVREPVDATSPEGRSAKDSRIEPDMDSPDTVPTGPNDAVFPEDIILPADAVTNDILESSDLAVAPNDAVSEIGAEPLDIGIEDTGSNFEDTGSNFEDIGTADAGTELPSKPLYLLSINNSQKTLEKIDILTGAATDICQLPPSSNYPSLTFSRNNTLFGSRQGSYLDAIDPCTCEVTSIGPYGGGITGVNGITSDFGINLFGISHTQDVFITIDSQNGTGSEVGALGVNFGYTGATWSESENVVYAIDAAGDDLYKINPDTGLATFVAPLSIPMGTVGIEMHPTNGILYACSDPSNLLSIDLTTGDVTTIGPMNQGAYCNNLAAPWADVPCLDTL